jgi:hypothetical protein
LIRDRPEIIGSPGEWYILSLSQYPQREQKGV